MKCQASQFWVENLVCSVFIFPSSSYLPTVRDGLAGWGPTWPRKRSLRRRHHWEDLGFSATLGAQQNCKESLVNCYVTVLGGEGTGGVPLLFYGIHLWPLQIKVSVVVFSWGQGLIVAKSGDMMSSWANSASSFPRFFSEHRAGPPWAAKKQLRVFKVAEKKTLAHENPTKI